MRQQVSFPRGRVVPGGWLDSRERPQIEEVRREPEPTSPRDASGGPVGGVTAPPSFTHSGFRYVLGYTDDVYAIWDREHPDEPRERFPRTDDGWAEAWNRFRELEPNAAPVGASGPSTFGAPAAAGSTLVVEEIGGLGTALTVLLGLAGVSSFVQGVLWFRRSDDLDVTPGATLEQVLARPDGGVTAIGGLGGLVTLAAAITWLVWQHRAQRNLWAIGVPGLRFTPGWAVGWWFVPIANAWQPVRAVRELWLASEPDAEGAEWRTRRTPPLIPLWWAAYVGVPLIAGLVFGIRNGDLFLQLPLQVRVGGNEALGVAELTQLVTEIGRFQLIFGVANLIAAALAIGVVRNIVSRHERRLADPPVRPAGEVAAAGTEPVFTHSGHEHVLGAYRGEYAIWRREHPGDPAESFPGTAEGWDTAWRRFRELEPHAAAVGAAGTAPPGAAGAVAGMGRATLMLGIVALIPYLAVLFAPLAWIVGGIGYGQLGGSAAPDRDRGRLRLGMILAGIGALVTVALIVAEV